MARWKKVMLIVALSCLTLVALAAVGVWALTWHPQDVQSEPVVCSAELPPLPADRPVKLMSWNVQFLAGKDFVFFYDLLDGSGPDKRPTRTAIEATLGELVRVIAAEQPDVLLLQEVDDGAARTDGEDQAQRIVDALGGHWCATSAFYWKAAFVPHPLIMGSVGMKLTTLSPWAMTRSTRHQLALIPSDPISKQFGLKRAVLQTEMPLSDGRTLTVFNTHLDAFAQGTDTMARQVETVDRLLSEAEATGEPWVAGGDFNLLASQAAYDRLSEPQRAYYQPQTEMARLHKKYRVVPTEADTKAPGHARWTTYFSNDPDVLEPDRTIDYFVLPKSAQTLEYRVRREDTLAISDHLPLIATVSFEPGETSAISPK